MKKSLVTIALVGSMGFSIVSVQATPVDDAQATDVEMIMVPVFNPITGEMENRPCSTAPACEHHDTTINPESEKEEQE